jgi:predicted GNAT family acetyltransferase
MAEMAHDAANLRDAGVPIASVEARLQRDVKKRDELAMALTVVRLVYRTQGTAQALKDAAIEKCKAQPH